MVSLTGSTPHAVVRAKWEAAKIAQCNKPSVEDTKAPPLRFDSPYYQWHNVRMNKELLKMLFKGRVALRHLMLDGLVIVTSLVVSMYLRAGPTLFREYIDIMAWFLPAILVVRWICLYMMGCYRTIWRYISLEDASRLVKAVALSTLIIIAASFLLPSRYMALPRSVYIIDAIVTLLGLTSVRSLRRLAYENQSSRHMSDGRRTLIYGAGNNGRLLAHRFRSDSSAGINLIGFIDDDPGKLAKNIGGIPVLGNRQTLPEVLEEQQISQLIVALPKLPGELLREIVQITRRFNIKPRITSRIADVAADKSAVDIYRDIELSDLLNRPRCEIDLRSVKEMIAGKRVLVTGAGGSIGSELARQIMSHEPGKLVLLDHSEFNLYEIDKELRLSTQDTQRVVPLLIDLKDEESVHIAMKEYAPEIVIHAAAYKHVHLVESNPHSSILNNVLGTKILLDACEKTDVQTFVLISTDKAVNPAGVMGSTKRVCELLVTERALRLNRRYCSVRFGNVLGSSGSLIPLLQRQISDGGPVTITHQDMTRFFMLIPEAVSLVLKAATIAIPGDINVLRMGEPVKIVDIAKSLFALCGKTEDEVPIIFTGLRPGEKMFEELYIRGDELKTEHPDILTLPNGDSLLAGNPSEAAELLSRVEKMISAAYKGSKDAIFELNQLVKSEYVAPISAQLNLGTSPVPTSLRTSAN